MAMVIPFPSRDPDPVDADVEARWSRVDAVLTELCQLHGQLAEAHIHPSAQFLYDLVEGAALRLLLAARGMS